MSSPSLGRVQLMIMQILWERASATAREITEAINQKEACAHSTVQTLLRGLEEKGAVRHESQDRTFVFYPLVKEHEFKRGATRDVLERVFGGSVSGLVAHLLKEENVSREEIEEIRKLINQRMRKPQ
ncbi:MAG TPA: BlaI/MecI/CopY family transcriptional regulator [Pirellulales bacterium]